MGTSRNIDFLTSRAFQSGDLDLKGYRREEASQFIEFCVELDNQDEREVQHNAGNFNSVFDPRIDPNQWNLIYDSREAVADDAVGFSKDSSSARYLHWKKLYSKIASRANRKYSGQWQADTLFADPSLNGFGPWNNAWLLYEGLGMFTGSYAIALRGTIFSHAPSALENAWFYTVNAANFLSPAVHFADITDAALHSGFAHATFTLMLDDRYGVLRILEDKQVAAGSRLYIVGHSQGAAMATLAQAFLHYAMRNDVLAAKPVFGLKDRNYKLKSYGFAQPKPGDHRFGFDFASITQPYDNAIVINNVLDAVPQVPMTLQALGDLAKDFKGGNIVVRMIQLLASAGSAIRRAIALLVEPFVKRSAEGFGYFYHYDELIVPDAGLFGINKMASTWDFTPAGRVLFVYGTPGDPRDTFLQHHAWTYRALIREQLHD